MKTILFICGFFGAIIGVGILNDSFMIGILTVIISGLLMLHNKDAIEDLEQ
jgi:hypothetical protein